MAKRSKTQHNIPNPGSDEALDLGCTCAVMDNNHGRGFPYPRRDGLDPEEHPSFYVNADCPLHSQGHTVDLPDG